ncbi:alpha/beta-hydrolase [Acaromyces ingoldii]|uniref:Alpha/beta-hydrolase n=1 Tax=Acaromyces ingoldii TaxID=215250 RepID=A0A316YZQ7_9BASI|nr:alpha/beta-hydrolase [Acaromyces ingoldii]PWN93523.1 alpha/beta-hydrolase [Acaromyces ingoldii]
MTISLSHVATSTTPTVVKTFIKHYVTQMRKEKEDRRTEATDELLFHEAFMIIKQFIEIATRDTVESLQSFTNTHVPAAPTTRVSRVIVPLESCDEAAKWLIEYFGEKDLRDLVGGAKWWQVRGLAGIQAEWMAMRDDWKRAEFVDGANISQPELFEKAKTAKQNKRHERKVSRHKVEGMRSRRSLNGKDHHQKHQKRRKRREGNGDNGGSDVDDEDDDGEFDSEGQKFEELDRLKRVMYYVHGGGTYFGSINTHRIMIVRFARKFGGRAFAINYRKAPNYPWPCPLHDVLAGYFYLINPPPGAKHKAIDPSNIVIAGDSAGGGLCLALLAVLRDLGKPQPSGAVLLSPWCDMTHSFPSILQNTDTDIIPRYSFIHKPSTLWPVPGVRPEKGSKKHAAGKEDGEAKADKGEKHNEASHPPKARSDHNSRTPTARTPTGERKPELAVPHGVDPSLDSGKGIKEKLGLHGATDRQGLSVAEVRSNESDHPEAEIATEGAADPAQPVIAPPLDHLYADPIQVAVQGKDGENKTIALRQQIQLYATNAQVFHPLCSPILQGSLGGLPPLYILAGDSEVLRDEIIYLAHRAARPKMYPLNDDLLSQNERARHDAERYNDKPTKVHLQVYDGQPHVLTLFSFTTSARYAYRAIASFVKHVTGAPTTYVSPFPTEAERLEHSDTRTTVSTSGWTPFGSSHRIETGREAKADNDGDERNLDRIDTSLGRSSPQALSPEILSPEQQQQQQQSSSSGSSDAGGSSGPPTSAPPVDGPVEGATLRDRRRRNVTLGQANEYDGQVPLKRPTYVDEMIRERVDIRGQIRPLEDDSKLQALQMPCTEVGVIKEGPVKRYLTGQELWDNKFKREAKKVEKRRAKNEERAKAMIERAAELGLVGPRWEEAKEKKMKDSSKSLQKEESNGSVQEDERWADLGSFGPLDLQGERPPPSAIAGRRDTGEALELLRTSLHMRAKSLGMGHDEGAGVLYGLKGHHKVGAHTRNRVRAREATNARGKQSAAEKEQKTRARYGLKAWGDAISYFSAKRGRRAKQASREGYVEEEEEDEEDGDITETEQGTQQARTVETPTPNESHP